MSKIHTAYLVALVMIKLTTLKKYWGNRKLRAKMGIQRKQLLTYCFVLKQRNVHVLPSLAAPSCEFGDVGEFPSRFEVGSREEAWWVARCARRAWEVLGLGNVAENFVFKPEVDM
jgi:hypothetical protein